MIIHTFYLVNNIFFIGPILWTTPGRRCIDLFRAGGCFGVAQLQACSAAWVREVLAVNGLANTASWAAGPHTRRCWVQGAPPQAHPAPRSPAPGLRNSSVG